MSLDQLALLGEFVGGIFVVISLVYVAHQVRQHTRSLRTENYARVLERMSSLQSRMAVDSALNRIFVVGAEEPGRLTPGERLRFAWALYEMLVALLSRDPGLVGRQAGTPHGRFRGLRHGGAPSAQGRPGRHRELAAIRDGRALRAGAPGDGNTLRLTRLRGRDSGARRKFPPSI